MDRLCKPKAISLSRQYNHPERRTGLALCNRSLSRFGRELRHQFGDALELQPPLVLGALILDVGHAVEVTHIVEYELSVLQADEGAVAGALVTFIDKIIKTQARNRVA